MRLRLLGERGDVKSAERHEAALGAVVVGDAIRAGGVGDVDLDHDQVGPIVGVEPLDVLVDDHGFVVGRQIRGERGQTERREQGVFDRAPVGAGGFGQRGENERDAKRAGRGRHLANYFTIKSDLP